MSGILAAIIAAVGAVFAAILKARSKSTAPTPEAQAAAAQTQLATEETTNAQVAEAIQATRQSDARLAADPGSLRAPDPDSRD